MDKKKWKVPYPTNAEIDQQVASIVKQALPARQGFIRALLEMKRQIGWQYLLLSRGEALFSGLVVLILLGYVWLTTNEKTVHYPTFYGLLFMLSPLAFLSLTAYAYYQKQTNHTFELEMTMKYTVFQLLVCRMLFFSGLAIVVNMSFLLLLSLKVEFDVLRVLLLSLTGLFTFSVGLLLALSNGRMLKRSVFFIAGWITLNVFFLIFVDKTYARILESLPITVYVGLLIGILGLYLYSFKHVFMKKQEGVFEC